LAHSASLPLFAVDGSSSTLAPKHVFAGTSGWSYPTWKPGFYPVSVSSKRFLEYYGTRLNSVEVNFTFRKLPTESMMSSWLAAVPQDFRFSFKAPQRITHFNRLRDCEGLVASFVSSVELAQQAGKLGLLLFQLPPTFKVSAHRLEEFLAFSSLNGPSAPQVAFEFRDQSWFTEEVYAILYGTTMLHSASPRPMTCKRPLCNAHGLMRPSGCAVPAATPRSKSRHSPSELCLWRLNGICTSTSNMKTIQAAL